MVSRPRLGIRDGLFHRLLLHIDEDWRDVSKEAKALITKMLTMNPKDRISAMDCLHDAWIRNNTKTAPLNTKVLDNLSKFHVRIATPAFSHTFSRKINSEMQFSHSWSFKL